MAFNIQAKIGADGSGFFREINRVKKAASGLAESAISGFGIPLGAAAAGVAVTTLAAKTVEYGGKINDLSARLGVSTAALQEFDYAMTLNGATLDDATAAMQKLGAARQEALEKGGDKLVSFQALGIDVEQLKTARLEDLFKGVARSVRDAADVQTVLVDAFQVMGKGSGNVLAAMRADIEAAGAEAHRLGLIIGEDTIARLDELGDTATTTGQRLMASFAPFITFVMEGVNSIIDGFDVLFSIAGRYGEMAGKIAAGVPIGQAVAEKDAGIQQDLVQIQERKEARQQARTIAPRGEAALNFRGEGVDENKVTREAENQLKLKEKILKLELDLLSKSERRAVLEKNKIEAEKEYQRLLQELAESDPTDLQASQLEFLEKYQVRAEGELRGLQPQIAEQKRVVNALEIGAINNPTDERAQQKMRDAQEKLAEMLFKESQITERLNDLKLQIVQLSEEVVANPEDPELSARLDAAKLAKLQAEKDLADLDEKANKGDRSPERNVDSLARVGIFLGGVPTGVKTTPLTGEQAERLNATLVRALQASNAALVQAVNRSAQATKEVLG